MKRETSKLGWKWEKKQKIRMIIRGEISESGWAWENKQLDKDKHERRNK